VKALFIHSFLITTLLSLVGCGSKENSVKLEVSAGLALTSAGYTGGLVVSGKNAIGQRFVKTVFGGSSLEVVLPDGAWDLSVVGWDGAAPVDATSGTVDRSPFSGQPYCGKTTVNLASNDSRASINVNQANCLGDDFSGGQHSINTPALKAIRPLKIVTCGSFYKHNLVNHNITTPALKITAANSDTITSDFCYNSTNNHPSDLRSRTKSIKIIPLDKNFDGPFSGLQNSNPYCQTGSNGVFSISQQIPVSGLPVQIAFYEDTDCKNQKGFVLFPDGLKAGYAPKFDSIFDYVLTEVSPFTPGNRLIVSDSEFNRGWSPLYHLMPHTRCANGFCGELPGAALFDYFASVDYQGTHNSEPFKIKIPTKDSNLCTTLTYPATSMIDQTKDSCTYYPADGGYVELNLFPIANVSDSNCNSMISDICSSPLNTFSYTIGGETKRIYFQGQKDYSTSYAGYKTVRFSHFPETVFIEAALLGCTTLTPLTYTSTLTGTNLQPVTSCINIASKAHAQVKASYGTTTFNVSDDPSVALGKMTFAESPNNQMLIMLPPEQREHRDIFRIVSESVGADGIIDSFKYEGQSSNDDADSEKYGSLRRAREMFSPNGPSMLFDHNTSCSALDGTKSITMTDKGQTETYEIKIETIDPNHPGWTADPNLLRTLAFCVGSIPAASTCFANSGRFEKRMMIKKNGILEEVMLFDCTQLAGRIESRTAEYKEGKYRREKEILNWNSQDLGNARFERRSIDMEATLNTFSQTSLLQKRYRYEKVYKDGNSVIDGRVIEFGFHKNGSSPLSQNLNSTRFRIDDSGGSKLIYANYNLHENGVVKNFFEDAEFATVKIDTFSSPHFCGTVTFPFALDSSCAAFGSSSSSINYTNVAPATFLSSISTGYFSVTGW
jgi:hypothetical protein